MERDKTTRISRDIGEKKYVYWTGPRTPLIKVKKAVLMRDWNSEARREKNSIFEHAIFALPIIAIFWAYAGYLLYSYSSLRAEALEEVHAVSGMNIIEATYVAGLPPGPVTHCFSIKKEDVLAALSASLAAADDKGNTNHAYLEAEFSLFFTTAEAGRVRFKGNIYRHAPNDVFLWSGIIEARTARNSEYGGYPVRVPGLADMLLDRVDENNCPRW